jgi:tetratricopeptide (TPR) repeat protein
MPRWVIPLGLIPYFRKQIRGEEEIFPKIDELTRKIKTNFELSPEDIASDIDKEVGKITTSSPEAYKYYSEGKKSYDRGDDRKAVQFYEKAVAIDPEFATAYMDMAVSYHNLGLYSEHNKYLQKALALGDRVSDRERYLNEAQFYVQSEKTYGKAIEAFNKLLEHYPGDVDGNADLGWVYMRLEQWDKAIERYKVNVQNKVEEVYSYTNLASLYEAKGLYDKAKDVLEFYLNNFSDNYDIHWNLAYNYISQGKYDLALVEADKAFILNPTHFDNAYPKGEIYLYQGDLMKAEEEYQKLLNSREPLDYNWGLVSLLCLNLLQGKFEKVEILGRQGIEFANKVGEDVWKSRWHLFAARHYLRSGNHKRALKECDEAWNIAKETDYLSGQRRALYNKGLVFVEMKAMDEAQRAADHLKEMVEQGMNKKLMRYYFNLTGRIELERGNFSEAIKYFKEALSLLSYGPLTKRADFIDSLALAYYKSEDLEKAREEYEKITSLTTGRFFYGDIYAKSFYMLGKIYEQQGQINKSIEHYRKFLDLWKDADPGIAEVEDARKRLAALKVT